MKKVISIVAIVVLSLAFRTSVFALEATCTQSEQLRLRELVLTTQITYEYVEPTAEQNEYGFTVQIRGFSPDFYVYNQTNGLYFNYDGSTIATNGGLNDGVTYQLPFYASDSGPCKGYLILTKSVSLPNYNPFYKNPLCVGHETYELCKKFTPLVIGSASDFEKRMNQYIKSLDDKNDDNPTPVTPTETLTIWQRIGDFFINYYMVFLISIIVLGTTGIVIIEVKKRRSIL